MKVVILNRNDLSVASSYDADAPQQNKYGGPWGNPDATIHVAIPSDVDFRAAQYEWDGDTVVVTEDEDVKAEIDQQDAVRAVQTAVANAIAFGNQLIVEFAAENVLLGITQDGMTGAVLTKMAPTMTALQSGSLYEAIGRAQAVLVDGQDPKYITPTRILAFINKIEAYLGLPLSL